MGAQEITSVKDFSGVNRLSDGNGFNCRDNLKILIVGAGIGVSVPVKYLYSEGIK
jgi:hypothetical protein